MARQRKTGNDLLKSRITKRTDKAIPYARIYADLFDSEQFQALTPTARLLFIDMLIKSGGQDDFVFPRREYKNRYSPSVFTSSKDQLIKAGFLKETVFYKQDSKYRICSDWQRSEPIRKEKPKRGNNLKP